MTSPDAPSFEQRPMAPFDWLLLVTAAGIWGSSFLFMDIALDAEHPGLVAWLRPLLGLAFMAGVPSARRPVDRSDNPRLFLLGLLWMAVLRVLPSVAEEFFSTILHFVRGGSRVVKGNRL